MYKKISRNMQLLCMLTLLLTAVVVFSSNYSFLNIRQKNEAKSLAEVISGILNSDNGDASDLSGLDSSGDFRITVFNNNRDIIFDSMPSSVEKPSTDNEALRKAAADGTGETPESFSLSGGSTYSYAVRLENGNLLQVSATAPIITKSFVSLVAPLIFMFFLIYLICVVLSWFLTENITKPINEINLTDIGNSENQNIYPELAPLMNKIKAQTNEIERQIVKLKTRKTRFQTVSENISEGVLTLDADCNILSMNKSAENIFGVIEENAVHMPLSDFDADKKLCKALEVAANGEHGFTIVNLGEKAFNAFYSPVFENGIVCGIVLLLLDITEKLKSENIRKEFTANVSHELKTPLTTILGYSQIINNGIAKPEDITGFSRKIEKEASRLITLIDDIIKLSHLDEQKNVTDSQPVHMSHIVSDVTDRLRINAKNKNINFEISGTDFVIHGNLMQLTELVYNLCDNAIKYTPENGQVSIVTGDRFVKVTDNGIGIPEEYHERIFERFFRVDKSHSKSVNGTGLGLSIVKHIAEKYDARIKVDSLPGKGTIITVFFDGKSDI